MKWWLKILFALVYTVGYFFLALLSTGGGHGNFYLLTPIIPWIFTIINIILLGKLNDLIMRIIFIALMLTHYILLAIFLMNYDFGDDKGWTRHSVPFAPISWYLAGQIIIWFLFLDETGKSKKAG